MVFLSDELNPTLRSMFSEAEMGEILAAHDGARRHPIARVFDPENRDQQVAVNTERAARRVFSHDEAWIRRQIHRLLVQEDFSTPSSVLGELRA